MTELEGARIGAYQLVRRLGGGPAGTVYLAQVAGQSGSVVLRILPGPRQLGIEAAAPDVPGTQRFLREAERLRQLDAPGILPLLAYGAESGVFYLAAPYVAVSTLSDAIRAGRLSDPSQPLPLAPEVVAAIVRQVAVALQTAHDQGIIHERVRTRNIFITWQEGAQRPGSAAEQPWTLLLADCGRTGLLRAIGADQLDASVALYTAPEQRAGLPVPASDQYALACMAFQLLTGQAVFTGTVEELERQHRMVSPPLASRTNPRLPRAADALFLRALAKAPDQRYPSIRDFALAVDTVFGRETMRPTGEPPRPHATGEETDVLATMKFTRPGARAQRIPDGIPALLPTHTAHSGTVASPLPRLGSPRRAGLALLALVVVLASLGGLALALAHRAPGVSAQGPQIVRVGAPASLTTQTADITRGGTVIFGALPELQSGHPPAQATTLPQFTGKSATQTAAAYAAAAHLSHLPASSAPLSGVPGVSSAVPTEQLAGLGQRDVGIGSPMDVSLGSGSGYLIEAVDGTLAVYADGGQIVGGPFALADVFALVARTDNTLGEPRVLFDAGSRRWLLVASEQGSQDGGVVSGSFDIAISAGTNPLEGWTVYQLDTQLRGSMGCGWADDPRIGTDAAAYYLTGMELHCGTNAYLIGAALWRLPKQTFAGGRLGTVTAWMGFTAVRGKPALSLAPAVEGGSDTTEWLVGNDAGYADNGTLSKQVTLWAFVDASHTSDTPVVVSAVVPLQTPYADPPLAAQSDSARPVETGDARVTSAVLAGGHLYAAFTTAVNWKGDSATRAGVYWLDVVPQVVPLAQTGGENGATAPVRANVFGFAGGYTFYQQIAADAAGGVALAMTAASATLAPSILSAVYHTSDGRDTLTRAVLLARGDQPTRSHWGDYLAATLAQPEGRNSSGAPPAVWVAGAVDAGAPGTWRTLIWQVSIGGSSSMYSQPATALTPALVVYLIDASDSMNEPYGTATKIALVNQALRAAVKDMVRRSMRDGVVQRRYKLAIFAYSTRVIDVLGGIRDLPDLLKTGVPELSAGGVTDTAAGFASVEALLAGHRGEFQHSPAPLVCHLTDGVFTTVDPSPVIRRVQALGVNDGPVLVENVYVADGMLRRPVADWQQWPGILRENELANDYARFLYSLSSPMPETYRQNINNYGYHIQPGAALFFPGFHSDLVRLAFVISAATQLK